MSGQPTPDYSSPFPCCLCGVPSSFPARPFPSSWVAPRRSPWPSNLITKDLPYVVVFSQRVAETDDPGLADLHEYGTLARVVTIDKQRKGTARHGFGGRGACSRRLSGDPHPVSPGAGGPDPDAARGRRRAGSPRDEPARSNPRSSQARSRHPARDRGPRRGHRVAGRSGRLRRDVHRSAGRGEGRPARDGGAEAAHPQAAGARQPAP